MKELKEAILNCACSYFDVKKEDILNKNLHTANVVYPRKVIARLLEEQGVKRTDIGVFLKTGERTKVIYYLKKINGTIDVGDRAVLQDLQTIREMVGGRLERQLVQVDGQRVEILYQIVEKNIHIKDISCKNVVSLLHSLQADNALKSLSKFIS